MKSYIKIFKNHLHYLLAVAATIICTGCSATSRLGIAQVSQSNGLPCFTIPFNAETKNGLPLHGIVVTEIKSADWRTLPRELWHFAVDPTAPVQLRPEQCIRYGEAPASAIQQTVKPLENFHAYAVSVRAREENSSMISYIAEFCIKSDITGKLTVHVISPDKRGGYKRYEVCVKP